MISFIFKSKMPTSKTITGASFRLLIFGLFITLIFNCIACHGDRSGKKGAVVFSRNSDSTRYSVTSDKYQPVNAMLILPENPEPGEPFRILVTGGENIRKAQLVVTGPAGSLKSLKSKTGEELPQWRIEDFEGSSAGKYKAELIVDNNVSSDLVFEISPGRVTPENGLIWKTLRGWDSGTETIYSAWINSLFQGCDERSSWPSLHEVTRNRNQNFLYNYLSLGEDDPDGKNSVTMQPDCADNPFFLRAYFAWKLGLPFGYHLCDRGYLGHNPKTGKWITNETYSSKIDPVSSFNSFLRMMKDGIHSGTARTALDDESSDYYPVPLERGALRPGTVFADPYGHTLILVGQVPQSGNNPGLLLAVDAQPDGTIGIKRFWKGNFLFNTTGVIGEPGFKTFRPISVKNGKPYPMQNKDLILKDGFVPFSLQQRKMNTDVFYHTMERLINPSPLDPESELLSLIHALHEQLLVRVTSVANGEAYFKLHPAAVIPMPSSAAGIFQTGGQWEDFSTPNRDLRLLIAMDAVLGFPDLVAGSPGDFKISGSLTPDQIKKKLQSILDKEISELTINYTRTDGSLRTLTISEILKRRDSFEMAYNPNDGIEIRWGAPENSDERSTCHRRAPSNQLEKMRSVRTWFSKRLHPLT
jgi:hypothetical protein